MVHPFTFKFGEVQAKPAEEFELRTGWRRTDRTDIYRLHCLFGCRKTEDVLRGDGCFDCTCRGCMVFFFFSGKVKHSGLNVSEPSEEQWVNNNAVVIDCSTPKAFTSSKSRLSKEV